MENQSSSDLQALISGLQNFMYSFYSGHSIFYVDLKDVAVVKTTVTQCYLF